MKLGLIQNAPVFGDKLRNQNEIEALVAGHVADLWVLPELALTGYEFIDRADALKYAEEIPNGESCLWLTEFCRKRTCAAVMGLAERSGNYVYNSCVLTTADGIRGHYRKIHLFDLEKKRFDPGDLGFAVHTLAGVRIGLMICFDWRFPEAARTLSLRGAQVIAHPSNLVMPYCQRAMVTRALENRVFFATVNRVGTESRAGRKIAFTGGSVVVTPDGETAIELSTDRPEVAVIDIDPTIADDKMVTSTNDVLKDRRPEFYQR